MTGAVWVSDARFAVLNHKHEEMNGKLDEILNRVKETNGRLRAVERREIERDVKIATWFKALKYLSPLIALLVVIFIIALSSFLLEPDKAISILKALG